LDPITVSVLLTAAAKKVVDSLTSKASGQATDALLSKLKGDPTKKAFKSALGKAVMRYATGARLQLAKPLLDKDGVLTNPDVAKELACLIQFDREPNAALIGDRWKAALPDAPDRVDFTKEAQLLLSYLKQALGETDVFRPVFEAQSLRAIAASTTISKESLSDIDHSLSNLAGLIDSAFGEMTRFFSEATPKIHGQIADFTTFIEDRTQGFVGRQFVFDAFDKFTRDGACGYFLVLGDPGIGKSALSAQLVKTRGYVHHFNIRAQGINTASAFLKNVCAQLIAVYKLPYTAVVGEDAQVGQNSNFLDKLFPEVVNKLQGKKAVIVVDGLDEVDNAALAPGVNPLYLPIVLPEGIYIFATMRKETVQPRLDCRSESYLIHYDSEVNATDVREYIQLAVSRPGIQAYIASQGINETVFVDHLARKSEGNFMYLRYVLPEIERGAYKDLALKALPVGLKNYYEDHWRRMRSQDEDAWFKYKLPVVMALTVVKLPVSIDLIAKFSGVNELPRIRGVLQDWGQFLHQEIVNNNEESQKRYRLYHESFLDFIAVKEEVQDERVSRKGANKKIADVLYKGLYGDD
jgi:hypothetical protein